MNVPVKIRTLNRWTRGERLWIDHSCVLLFNWRHHKSNNFLSFFFFLKKRISLRTKGVQNSSLNATSSASKSNISELYGKGRNSSRTAEWKLPNIQVSSQGSVTLKETSVDGWKWPTQKIKKMNNYEYTHTADQYHGPPAPSKLLSSFNKKNKKKKEDNEIEVGFVYCRHWAPRSCTPHDISCFVAMWAKSWTCTNFTNRKQFFSFFFFFIVCCHHSLNVHVAHS